MVCLLFLTSLARLAGYIGNDKVDQFLALEESTPHVVPLAGRNLQLHRAAQFPVGLRQRRRVGLERHDLIRVTVDMEDRYPRLRHRREPWDRVVLVKFCRKFRLGHTIAFASLADARITSHVTDRIDPSDAAHFLRILDRPTVEHQAAAAARQQASLRVEPVFLDQRLVQRVVGRTPVGTPLGFAHVDAGDGDSPVE